MRIYEINPGEKRQIEISKFDNEQHFEKIWSKLIVPNCSEILKIYQQSHRILYRGTKSETKNIYRSSSRIERRPKDSNNELSNLFDQMLAANGMTALRSNSFFATSDKRHAASFGKVFFIFPINGFNYTFTNRADIVLESFLDFIKHSDSDLINKIWIDAMRKKFSQEVSNNLTAYHTWITYKKESNNDTQLVQLEKSIARLKNLDPTNQTVQELSVEKLINPNTFKEIYNPKNTDLTYALDKELEVYIQGQYYAVSFDHIVQLEKLLFFYIK